MPRIPKAATTTERGASSRMACRLFSSEGVPCLMEERALRKPYGSPCRALLPCAWGTDGRHTGNKEKEKTVTRNTGDRLFFVSVARPGGFEPPAKSLEGSCSIHLSYERVLSL